MKGVDYRMENNEFWQLTAFSKKVDMHFTTINVWFDTLEKKRIHYVNRRSDVNQKIYDTLDLKVGLFIKEKREAGWNLEGIYGTLIDSPPFELRPFPVDYKEEIETSISKDFLFAELSSYVQREIKLALETQQRSFEQHLLQIEELSSQTMEQRNEDLEAQQTLVQTEIEKALKKQEEIFHDRLEQVQVENRNNVLSDRQQRITDMITQQRVETILELEALKEWNQLPASERLIKVGLFKKEENSVKRNLYVKEYIQKNFENRLKAEIMNTETNQD